MPKFVLRNLSYPNYMRAVYRHGFLEAQHKRACMDL